MELIQLTVRKNSLMIILSKIGDGIYKNKDFHKTILN